MHFIVLFLLNLNIVLSFVILMCTLLCFSFLLFIIDGQA